MDPCDDHSENSKKHVAGSHSATSHSSPPNLQLSTSNLQLSASQLNEVLNFNADPTTPRVIGPDISSPPETPGDVNNSEKGGNISLAKTSSSCSPFTSIDLSPSCPDLEDDEKPQRRKPKWKQAEDIWQCSECGKTYSSSGHLARHKRSHSNLTMYSCPIEGCQARFNRTDNAKSHYQNHLKHLDNPAWLTRPVGAKNPRRTSAATRRRPRRPVAASTSASMSEASISGTPQAISSQSFPENTELPPLVSPIHPRLEPDFFAGMAFYDTLSSPSTTSVETFAASPLLGNFMPVPTNPSQASQQTKPEDFQSDADNAFKSENVQPKLEDPE